MVNPALPIAGPGRGKRGDASDSEASEDSAIYYSELTQQQWECMDWEDKHSFHETYEIMEHREKYGDRARVIYADRDAFCESSAEEKDEDANIFVSAGVHYEVAARNPGFIPKRGGCAKVCVICTAASGGEWTHGVRVPKVNDDLSLEEQIKAHRQGPEHREAAAALRLNKEDLTRLEADLVMTAQMMAPSGEWPLVSCEACDVELQWQDVVRHALSVTHYENARQRAWGLNCERTAEATGRQVKAVLKEREKEGY